MEVVADDKVIVKCVFAISSDADGCYVVLNDTQSSYFKVVVIDRLYGDELVVMTTVTVEMSGYFTFAAYDIFDNSISNLAAVVYDDIIFLFHATSLSSRDALEQIFTSTTYTTITGNHNTSYIDYSVIECNLVITN